MDAPYPDPSRGRQKAPGVFARGTRLLGMAIFVTGLVMGCYAGFRWLQTGHSDATLIQDVILAKLPDRAQAWVARPESWYGLHRVMLWVLEIPLFASLAVGGFLILLAGTASGRR